MYYTVIHENNKEPYAFFEYCINWNVEKICESQNSSGNGFIVQMVHVETNISWIGIDEDYFEAWEVEEKQCKDQRKPDDSFNIKDPEIIPNDEYIPIVKLSVGTKGYIKYDTEIFWIDKINDNSLYNIVNNWEKRQNGMARDLKSEFVKNCPELLKKAALDKRHYEHSYDCSSVQNVQLSFEHAYAKALKDNKRYAKKRITELLEGTGYEEVIDLITEKYEL